MPGAMLLMNAEEMPAANGPRIQFDHLAWDFGSIVEGAIVEHAFPFRNTGGETLVILGVRASCGCTKSGVTRNQISPGETAAVFAEFNSSGKHGTIAKTVFVTTNAPDSSEIRLTIDIHVLAQAPKPAMRAHEGDSNTMMGTGQSIFDTACRSCHVEPALNTAGADLYEAACAMCHGSNLHIAVHDAPAILDGEYLTKKSPEYLRAKISLGTGSPMMPGFSDQNGGPLSADQIQSLLDYFALIKTPTR